MEAIRRCGYWEKSWTSKKNLGGAALESDPLRRSVLSPLPTLHPIHLPRMRTSRCSKRGTQVGCNCGEEISSISDNYVVVYGGLNGVVTTPTTVPRYVG